MTPGRGRVAALVLHRERVQAHSLGRDITAWLEAHGFDVVLPAGDAEVAGLSGKTFDEDHLPAGVDLVVSLGGDGTMLRAIHLVGTSRVPVLGVNVGQLGYLTEIEPLDAETALERFVAGEHTIEERMLLTVRVRSSGVTALALNEAVLEKTATGHTVRLGVTIDGQPWTTYAADGLIVATPTGSTAYSLSARGPIVAPDLRALVLTPVSPHMLFDRSMLFSAASTLVLEVDGHRPASLSVDGQNLGVLAEGDAIECAAAEVSARLVRFGPTSFHQVLKSKFGLSDR
ncbi:MAG: NAD(+)/NADH kinase [Acidimicrobiales bacterium]